MHLNQAPGVLFISTKTEILRSGVRSGILKICLRAIPVPNRLEDSHLKVSVNVHRGLVGV